MDNENNVSTPVAPVDNNAQAEQVVTPADVTNAPVAPTDKEELILGKFKSQEDLAKAYQESEAKLTQLAQARAREVQQVPTGYQAPINQEVPQLEPEAEVAVSRLVDARMEQARVNDFLVRHSTEMADPVLRGVTVDLIQQARASGRYLAQEDALKQAQSLIEERSKPQVTQATNQAFEEGKDLAKQKERAGAVGDTVATQPPVDDSKLSKEEFAAKYNLPRYQG